MMFNIAPETFMGYVMKDKPTHCDFDGKITEIDDEKHIICVNGAVFNRGKSVTIDFLKSVFAERKRFKKMMGVELKKYDTMNRELNLMKEELKELKSQR